MDKLFLILFICLSLNDGLAQKTQLAQKYPYGKFTLEPHLGTALSSLMGVPNVQVSTLLQYNVRKRVNVISYTAIQYGFGNNRIDDVRPNYDYTIAQQVGVGTSFYTKRSANSVYLLAGLKYDAYSGTFRNSELPEIITTKTSSYSPVYGIMYNVKRGTKKYFFSSSLYIPLGDGASGIVEKTNLGIGVGMRIK